MITVACLLWGDWPVEAVYKLKQGVSRHLNGFRFVCLTDRDVPGVETLPIGVDWPRNLKKMALYRPGLFKGRVLALDLDTVITGSLEDIAAYDGPFCVIEDFYDGNGLCGGGVIGFEADNVHLFRNLYLPVAHDPEAAALLCAGGSERYWFRRQFADMPFAPDFWQRVCPSQVVSAKPERTLIREVLENARMVCFHGKQKPWNSNAPWIAEHWI